MVFRILLAGVNDELERAVPDGIAAGTAAIEFVHNLTDVWRILDQQVPAVILLGDAVDFQVQLEFCRRVVSDSRFRGMGVIVSSPFGAEVEEVQAFEAGADDYVVGSRGIRIVVERLKAHLRRKRKKLQDRHHLRHGLFVLSRQTFSLSVDETAIGLTPTEFKLLWILFARQGQPVSRSELLEACTGKAWGVLERTIDGHVKLLRAKLGEWAGLVETVRGIGYRAGDCELASTDDVNADSFLAGNSQRLHQKSIFVR